MKETLRERCRSSFSSRLFELANIPFQKECWSAKIPNCQSDYGDLMEGLEFLWDDSTREVYLGDGILNQNEINDLMNLVPYLESVDNIDNDEDLWRNDYWVKASKLAKEIYFKHFENDERDYYQKYAPEELIRFNELIIKFPLK